MLPLMDYYGSHHAADGKKNGVEYSVSRGRMLDVPVLDQSRWVYEFLGKVLGNIGDYL